MRLPLGEGVGGLDTATGHPAVGRRIRTYKDMLFKKVEAEEKRGKDNTQWIDNNSANILTYTNKLVSFVTRMTPIEARKLKK